MWTFSGYDCEFCAPQSFSLSRKRQAFLVESQGGLSVDNAPEEVPPITGRNIQEVHCGVVRGWAAVYQTVAKRMLDYLNKSEVWRDGVSCAGTK